MNATRTEDCLADGRTFGFDLQVNFSPVIHLRVCADDEGEAIRKMDCLIQDEVDVEGIFHEYLLMGHDAQSVHPMAKLKRFSDLVAYVAGYPSRVDLCENVTGISVFRYDFDASLNRKLRSEVFGPIPDAFNGAVESGPRPGLEA